MERTSCSDLIKFYSSKNIFFVYEKKIIPNWTFADHEKKSKRPNWTFGFDDGFIAFHSPRWSRGAPPDFTAKRSVSSILIKLNEFIQYIHIFIYLLIYECMYNQ